MGNNTQNTDLSRNDGNTILSTVQFTEEELLLLQRILVSMNDRLDWDFKKDSGLIEARVLLDFDESIPSKINKIYYKLF